MSSSFIESKSPETASAVSRSSLEFRQDEPSMKYRRTTVLKRSCGAMKVERRAGRALSPSLSRGQWSHEVWGLAIRITYILYNSRRGASRRIPYYALLENVADDFALSSQR